MNNLQVLIENIRTVMSFPETVLPDQIQTYARDYAECCAECNRRMLQCIQHIRSGNIAEGIRLAEMKPNLTEMYLSLDFTEREEWIDIVSTLGFDVPQPLSDGHLKELNDMYLKMSPLEPLLRWHRLHALNNSSIRERLEILRAIAKVDPENLFWNEDQEKFEKARITELNKEIQNAVTSKNSEQIHALYEELEPTNWLVPPPNEFRQKLCESKLQGYADLLLHYFAAFDYSQASAIYGQIQQLLATNNMAIPSDVERTIRPVVLWLNETQKQTVLQNEFMHCSTVLQQALETESPVSILERLYYALSTAASQAGTIIPPELEELYRSQISDYELRKSRTVKVVVTSIVCLCLLIGSLIAWGLFQRHHSNRVQEILATLKKIDAIHNNAAEVVCELLEKMLSASGIDPILKCIFLDSFISDLSKIDPIFASNFKRYHEIVQKSGVDMFTNWMDVTSKNTIPQRNLAKAALDRLPDIKEITAKTLKEQSQLKNSIGNIYPQFEWIGILSRKDGTWNCQTKSTLNNATGDIYILRQKVDNTISPIKIGSVSNGKTQINTTISCLQCIPIFFKQ
ncbi:MAG: hypothetical protein LBE12_16230 [Planctomycetaceae bacterium]|jgi:hypothetical protein|nr:hypothetical protein [Planctomycetaceae bacterium]